MVCFFSGTNMGAALSDVEVPLCVFRLKQNDKIKP
jgi:hypothetical protein